MIRHRATGKYLEVRISPAGRKWQIIEGDEHIHDATPLYPPTQEPPDGQ